MPESNQVIQFFRIRYMTLNMFTTSNLSRSQCCSNLICKQRLRQHFPCEAIFGLIVILTFRDYRSLNQKPFRFATINCCVSSNINNYRFDKCIILCVTKTSLSVCFDRWYQLLPFQIIAMVMEGTTQIFGGDMTTKQTHISLAETIEWNFRNVGASVPHRLTLFLKKMFAHFFLFLLWFCYCNVYHSNSFDVRLFASLFSFIGVFLLVLFCKSWPSKNSFNPVTVRGKKVETWRNQRITDAMMKIQMTKYMKMNEIDELYAVLDGCAMHGQHHAHDTQIAAKKRKTTSTEPNAKRKKNKTERAEKQNNLNKNPIKMFRIIT